MRESIAESRRQRGVSSGLTIGIGEDESPVTPITPATSAFSSPHIEDRDFHQSLGWSERPRLPDIEEGVAHEFSSPFDIHEETKSPKCQPQQVQVQPAEDSVARARTLQSCPASIHTTPVPTRLALSHLTWGLVNNGNASLSLAQPHIQPIEPHGQLKITTAIGQPAHHPITWSPTDGSWDSQAHAMIEQTPQLVTSSMGSTLQSSWHTSAHVPLGPSWEQQASPIEAVSPPGTIDPRWVSPISSVWSTPAATPRVGSPVQLDPFLVPLETPAHNLTQPQVLAHHDGQEQHIVGTQSYPPRLSERRHTEPQTVFMFGDQFQSRLQIQPHAQSAGRIVFPANVSTHLDMPDSCARWFE